MDMTDLRTRGLVLLGCGKMGSAMLAGWLDGGLLAASVHVQDPAPSDWLQGIEGLNLNTDLPEAPALVLVAVKPQIMETALPDVAALGGGETLFVSVAAGTPIVRAMPNTPAAIAQGITAIIGNGDATDAHLGLAETLLRAVGQVLRLDSEAQMDAVTGLSGSGPAYVFHLIETMAAAGTEQGLAADLAMQLAIATVAGAGALARDGDESAAQLRVNVTSPNGTTAAGLEVLMNADSGLPPLIARTVAAATNRSKELGQ